MDALIAIVTAITLLAAAAIGVQLIRGRWLRLVAGAQHLPATELRTKNMRETGRGVGMALIALAAISLFLMAALSLR